MDESDSGLFFWKYAGQFISIFCAFLRWYAKSYDIFIFTMAVCDTEGSICPSVHDGTAIFEEIQYGRSQASPILSFDSVVTAHLCLN